jgi:hypothetical protein
MIIMKQIISQVAATVLLGAVVSQTAFAQGTQTLRDPLIPGAQRTLRFIQPADGALPPMGDGPTPIPVTPGMNGAPSALPWVLAVPSNQLGLSSSGITNVPLNLDLPLAPGVLGPAFALTNLIPAPPSVLGPNPGILQTSPYETGPGDFNSAEQVQVDQNSGGLPGTGGYGGSVPQNRRGGQQTHQWGGTYVNATRHQFFGKGSGKKGDVQDEMARVGPMAGLGLPNGVPTGNGFDKATNAFFDKRNSSIDLGGGMRKRSGTVTLSSGSSVQDYGLSSTRNNSNPALDAQQSTDFGQGFRNMVKDGLIQASSTTDFGIPYQQFNSANLSGTQKKGQGLPPTAIETNF